MKRKANRNKTRKAVRVTAGARPSTAKSATRAGAKTAMIKSAKPKSAKTKIAKTKSAKSKIAKTKLAKSKSAARAAAPVDALDTLIAASAPLLGLELDPAWHAGVRFNLQLILRLGALVDEFPLPDDAEPGPVFYA